MIFGNLPPQADTYTASGVDRPPKTVTQQFRQMHEALSEIREKAATMQNGGAWAAGLANLCLSTLSD